VLNLYRKQYVNVLETSMSFLDLALKSEYHSFEDNIVLNLLTPLLSNSVKYKRGAGYFSSSALVELTYGLSGLIQNNGEIYLISSSELHADDVMAIEKGLDCKEAICKTAIMTLREPVDEFDKERLNLLANLIANGILHIKIAYTKDGRGIFHDKFGVFYDDVENKIAFRGSMNESENAFYYNFEALDLYCSWKEPTRVESKEKLFDLMWNNQAAKLEVEEFPEISEEIVKRYRYNHNIDTTIDLRQFQKNNARKVYAGPPDLAVSENNYFVHKPSYVDIRDYQNEAVNQWEKQNWRGIFDMATGTGKTYTALWGLHQFERKNHDFAVIVLCPFIHLVDQWAEDVEEWGMNPIIGHSGSSDKNWKQRFANSYKRYRRSKTPFICLMTNDTFMTDDIQEIVKNISSDSNFILVVDEAHNVGAKRFSEILPENIKFRLALSATVERHMDEIGTKKIFDYFGEKCITYDLEKAIKEHALTQYEYYPIIVSLNDEEREEYESLTRQIGAYLENENGKLKISDDAEQLLYKRSRLIAGAEGKIAAFRDAFKPYVNKKHILVYCGATRGHEDYYGQKERQLDRIDDILGNEFHVAVHRFTSEEDAQTRRNIKSAFSDGDLQVLTAIKCLDEGVNIPNIHTAFILASSRNPKEFIQRRGRVLRKAKGKERAVIYDFVTLPRKVGDSACGEFQTYKSLILGEMTRIYEFGRFAINSRIALNALEEISEAYQVSVDYDSLLNEGEASYGDNY